LIRKSLGSRRTHFYIVSSARIVEVGARFGAPRLQSKLDIKFKVGSASQESQG